MHSRLYTFLLLAISALVVVACTSNDGKVTSRAGSANRTAPSTEIVYPDGVRRITIPEFEEMMKNNTAVVIDVRNQESYDAEHIPGAKLIPESEIIARITELPHDKLIVTYCS